MHEPRHRRPYGLRARLNDGPSDYQGRHVDPNPIDAICTHPEPKAVSS